MEPVTSELEAILHKIEKALSAKLYYLAIAVTLSVPDICACLEFDPENPQWADRKTYTRWCAENLDKKFRLLTGDDLYNIRGGVTHKGHFDHAKSRFDRVMFIGPESQFKSHEGIINVEPGTKFGGQDAAELRLSGKILLLDVTLFCRGVMDASREWLIKKSGDPFVQKNLGNLVRYKPSGLSPFIVGAPIIG